VTKAQCVNCGVTVDSALGFIYCECRSIAVDDGRIIAKDFENVIEVKE